MFQTKVVEKIKHLTFSYLFPKIVKLMR